MTGRSGRESLRGHWRNLSVYTESQQSAKVLSREPLWPCRQQAAGKQKPKQETRQGTQKTTGEWVSKYEAWTRGVSRRGRGEKWKEIWVDFEVRDDSIF